MFEKNTPRDFFLHAGAFASLYFSVIALIVLVFSVLEYVLPDNLQYMATYYDPYSGSVRFAIASLLVLAPLFIYLFSILEREARTNPERNRMSMRKWLTYVTLFIAGATIAGDTILVIDSFLGGELPMLFVLKVLVIFVIMGLGLVFFLLDIKNYWIQHVAHLRYFGMGILAMVLAAIVGGMLLIGSPMTQRNMRIDAQQISDLNMLSENIVQFWQRKGTLPSELVDIEDDLLGISVPKSPEGQPPYVYNVKSDLSFELCASFLTDTTQDAQTDKRGFLTSEMRWQHSIGKTCFSRTIDPKLFPKITPLTSPTLEGKTLPIVPAQ